ncbi:MAG: hypothetical protein IPM39_13835 [Chloroflexi bacterium]|nr:hypothetical protein [Chloroflexota bacterium]
MVLLHPELWLILLPTGITGIILLRRAKQLAEAKAKKARVPVPARKKHNY